MHGPINVKFIARVTKSIGMWNVGGNRLLGKPEGQRSNPRSRQRC